MDQEIAYILVWLWMAIALFIIFIRFFPTKIIEKLMYNHYLWWALGLVVFWNSRWRHTPIGAPTFWENVMSGNMDWLIPLGFAIVGIIWMVVFWWKIRKATINIEKTKALLEKMPKK